MQVTLARDQDSTNISFSLLKGYRLEFEVQGFETANFVVYITIANQELDQQNYSLD